MTHASLFSGIGGAEIAATQMGWRNLFHCEINPFGRKVLEYHYPNSESYEDITTTDFTKWQGKIDVLTGGFPCQPYSFAGQRRGDTDNRALWPEMLRAIREIQPSWVVAENVYGILSMVQSGEAVKMGRTSDIFEKNYLYREECQYTVSAICEDLEREGYSVQPLVIPACAVGAPHSRDRVWFIARHDASDRSDAGIKIQQERKDGVHAVGASSDSDDKRCHNRRDNRRERQICDDRQRNPTKDKSERTERERGTCETCAVASDTDSNRQRNRENKQERITECERTPDNSSNGKKGNVTDTDSKRLQRFCLPSRLEKKERHNEDGCPMQYTCNDRETHETNRWHDFPTQSPVCSRDDGISLGLADISFPK